MKSKLLTEKDIIEFENAWDIYWYKIKPVWDRLSDDSSEEYEICKRFYCALRGFQIKKDVK